MRKRFCAEARTETNQAEAKIVNISEGWSCESRHSAFFKKQNILRFMNGRVWGKTFSTRPTQQDDMNNKQPKAADAQAAFIQDA